MILARFRSPYGLCLGSFCPVLTVLTPQWAARRPPQGHPEKMTRPRRIHSLCVAGQNDTSETLQTRTTTSSFGGTTPFAEMRTSMFSLPVPSTPAWSLGRANGAAAEWRLRPRHPTAGRAPLRDGQAAAVADNHVGTDLGPQQEEAPNTVVNTAKGAWDKRSEPHSGSAPIPPKDTSKPYRGGRTWAPRKPRASTTRTT